MYSCFYRVIESLNQSIVSYDLNSLLEIWKHFENNIFSKIDPSKVFVFKHSYFLKEFFYFFKIFKY